MVYNLEKQNDRNYQRWRRFTGACTVPQFDRIFCAGLVLYALGFLALFLDVVIGASICNLGVAGMLFSPKDPK